MPRPLKFRRQSTGILASLFVLLGGFAGSFTLWFSLVLSPLQKQYFPTYMAIEISGGVARAFPVWWIWKTGPKHKPELADDADVISAGSIGGRQLPFSLSPEAQAQGWTGLLRVKQMGSPQNEQAVLQEEFFAGTSLTRLLITPLSGAAILLLLYFAYREKFGGQSSHEERHGRRTKGPELMPSFRWNRTAKPDGIRFKLASKLGSFGPSFRIPRKLESSHILLLGDTGSGKSNAIRQILHQVQERSEAAIVYDPAGEFIQEFYHPDRGDLVLNPLDERCPFWDLYDELYQAENADAIAAAMLPDKEYERGFFTDVPRRVLSRLLKSGPSAAKLLEWMADPSEIDRRLQGTPQAAFVDPMAGPQRGGVLASLNMIADSLALLPEDDGKRQKFVTGSWRFQRARWVFLTSKPSMRERILPLHSAWLDLFVLRMMEPCANPAKPVWFILDELASLNRLPQLHTAITENRKYGNPVVLGFQGRSQLEKRYGQDAEAMLSQPATKIFFKTSEPRAAKWISEALGEIEVERLKESRTPGLLRSKKNFAMEIATKPLVMASEIAGLDPLHAYIKQENRVVPVKFALVPKRILQPEFIPRKCEVPEPQPLTVAELPQVAVSTLEPVQSQLAKPVKAATVRKTRKTATNLPLSGSRPTLLLFAGPAPQKSSEPESRRSAFKKKGITREWKPVD